MKDESFKVMTREVKDLSKNVGGLSTDVALVKQEVGDLKQVTFTMSQCIKVLTETSIKFGENNITREQFYNKIDELVRSRATMISSVEHEMDQYKNMTDITISDLRNKIELMKVIIEEYQGLKKWVWGLIAVIVLAMIFEVYRVVIMHA